MIIGGHTVIYTEDADADRAFLRDVLGLSWADSGGGHLIFGLLPSEAAMHPDGPPPRVNGYHEFYLMCDDVEAFIAEMTQRGITMAPIQDDGWGLLTQVTLPGGGKLGVYQPKHERPEPMAGCETVRAGTSA